jgi:hypothetical protein
MLAMVAPCLDTFALGYGIVDGDPPACARAARHGSTRGVATQVDPLPVSVNSRQSL